MLDTAKTPNADLADAKQLTMDMGQLSFPIDLSGKSEKALIVGEIYRRNGSLKLRGVGQGFDGGLMAIATHFGVDVQVDTAPPPAHVSSPVQPVAAALSPAAPPSQVSLKKVTLAKSEKVSLAKAGGAIRAGEEAIVIERPETLRYALFAAYSAVKNGAGSFASYQPKMILTDQAGNEVTIPLLNPSQTSYWVAISHLTLGETVEIEHIETYGKKDFPHMIAAERAPRLHPDGSGDVSEGEIEFKK